MSCSSGRADMSRGTRNRRTTLARVTSPARAPEQADSNDREVEHVPAVAEIGPQPGPHRRHLDQALDAK